MYSSRRNFIDLFVEIGGGGGNSTLGGPYGLTPVFGTGDFSNWSTPPCQKLGAPPRIRTAHTEFAARPLTACCCGAWHPRGDSNTQSRVWNPLASPWATGAYGAPGWIRTSTIPLLRRLPLPLDYWRIGRLGRIRTDTGRGLSALPLPRLGYEPMVFGTRFELATMQPSTARVYQLRHPNIGGQSRI
jgi:hypothetical protein